VRADHVFIRPVIDGREGAMIDSSGFDAQGTTTYALTADSFQFAAEGDDDADAIFQLLSRKADNGDDYGALDETDTIEIANPNKD
jgi:hypothetical protein